VSGRGEGVEEARGSFSRYLEPVTQNAEKGSYEVHFQIVWNLWLKILKMQLLMLNLVLFGTCGR